MMRDRDTKSSRYLLAMVGEVLLVVIGEVLLAMMRGTTGYDRGSITDYDMIHDREGKKPIKCTLKTNRQTASYVSNDAKDDMGFLDSQWHRLARF